MAHPASIKRPASAQQFARVAANHRATSCAAAGYGQALDGATGCAIYSHSSATIRATITRGSSNKLAAIRGRRASECALMRAVGRGAAAHGGGRWPFQKKNFVRSEKHEIHAIMALWIQLAMGPQPLRLRNHNFGLAHRIMVKRLATSRHDPLGITDSACKNQLVVISVQYGPFNPYIPIRSTTIGKSRVAKFPIAMHTSWRSNSDIASVTRVSMTFRVVRTNQYNQDLGLIHSTNGNHLESLNEGSSIDHQFTIYLHAQNITMFPTNETCCFTINMNIEDLFCFKVLFHFVTTDSISARSSCIAQGEDSTGINHGCKALLRQVKADPYYTV
ncbi:putative LRR receptor-like protein kinase-like [Dorcoceras hygrometricum]|uniref:Putative LRR receptor-like protein kinase-like n=1 Tax=Dorcoceras hygrometricum TaxID=472368 RepID=A0A2Z7B1L3_9LAMI|nr:putative LRR receptor-like protein kinase-like [Dorcoceras hygrometricum]